MIKKYNTVMKVRMTEEDLMELEPPSSPGYFIYLLVSSSLASRGCWEGQKIALNHTKTCVKLL